MQTYNYVDQYGFTLTVNKGGTLFINSRVVGVNIEKLCELIHQYERDKQKTAEIPAVCTSEYWMSRSSIRT